MDIIQEILKGEKDPLKLANLRNKTCKKPEEAFVAALTGNFQKEHLFSLKQAIDLYDFTEKQLEECDKLIQGELERLPTITEYPIPMRDKDKKADGKYKRAKKPRKNAMSFRNLRDLLWKKSGV